jgi:ABC-type dipeptide/oligopeptide/nickel transport system permease subunit
MHLLESGRVASDFDCLIILTVIILNWFTSLIILSEICGSFLLTLEELVRADVLFCAVILQVYIEDAKNYGASHFECLFENYFPQHIPQYNAIFKTILKLCYFI